MLNPEQADPAAPAQVLRLKRGEERRLAGGHLWVFSNEIDTAATPLNGFAAGDIAALRSYRDAFLGYAYVNPHALICARILAHDSRQAIDGTLFESRLRSALTLRERLGSASHCRWCSANRTCCRASCSIGSATW